MDAKAARRSVDAFIAEFSACDPGVSAVDDLVSGRDVFFAATGVTDGYLLDGVRTVPDGAITESLVMRSRSGTIRTIRSEIFLKR